MTGLKYGFNGSHSEGVPRHLIDKHTSQQMPLMDFDPAKASEAGDNVLMLKHSFEQEKFDPERYASDNYDPEILEQIEFIQKAVLPSQEASELEEPLEQVFESKLNIQPASVENFHLIMA